MTACPSCGQGRLTRLSSRALAAARVGAAAGLFVLGGWGLWSSLGWLEPGKMDTLLWLFQLFFALFFAVLAVIPIVLGLVLLWRAPVYQCSHCWSQYQRNWFGGWQSRT